jgi:retron-type reverse transcriptase
MTIEFKELYKAYRDCRRRKRKTVNAQRYEMHLLDNLFETQASLNTRRYQPARCIRFIATKPKAREIHAADFSDRVVHHWLVPRLEKLFEPVFIHDVYSNRVGKGTHKAVDRLQSFMHSVGNEGWYLQLDIANFFNSVDRPVLFQLLQHRLRKSVKTHEKFPADKHAISPEEADALRWLCHVLLRHDSSSHAIYRGNPALLHRVPPHKQLGNMGEYKGLPIGNLTSQFFANVYLNPFDQFIKHTLKCGHYVRYVDDFILLALDKETLLEWREQIRKFLQNTLKLSLKEITEPKRVTTGANFLGYIIFPHYRLVRRRVVGNFWEKLQQFQTELVSGSSKEGYCITLKATVIEKLHATLASYHGHFKHANSYRLQQRLWQSFPWLDLLFEKHSPQPFRLTPSKGAKDKKQFAFNGFPPLKGEARSARGMCFKPRYEPYRLEVSGYYSQINYFQRQYPFAQLHIQCGKKTDVIKNMPSAFQIIKENQPLQKAVRRVNVRQVGYMKDGLKRRRVQQLFIRSGVELCPISKNH